MKELSDYAYRGARALVILHDRSVREFLSTWRDAKASNRALPETGDPTYQSYDTLLHHVLTWSRDYMVWTCEKLGLPDPGMRRVPALDRVAAELDDHAEQLLARWRIPLATVAPERFTESYVSRWNVDYCIDAMLEHAVMHPARHRFQLLELENGDRPPA